MIPLYLPLIHDDTGSNNVLTISTAQFHAASCDILTVLLGFALTLVSGLSAPILWRISAPFTSLSGAAFTRLTLLLVLKTKSCVFRPLQTATDYRYFTMSTTDSATASSQPATACQEIANASRPDPQLPLSSTPVEMSTLSSNSATPPAHPSSSSAQATAPLTSLPRETSRLAPRIPSQTSTSNPAQSHAAPPRINMSRACPTAIGPSSDQPMPLPKDESTGPTLMITLLLTTGARHPFKIDPKYLLKRNVDVQGNDPFNLSVYKLKELILREWREGIA